MQFLVICAVGLCLVLAMEKKERRASLVVLPPLVLGYDDLYDDSRQGKVTQLKGQITEEQQRLISYENEQHNHIKSVVHVHHHVKSAEHDHGHAKSKGHVHDHVKREGHVHDHVKSEEHGHDDAKSEGHGHDHVKNEGHVYDHVKSEGHVHEHVKTEGHIHEHANSVGHVGDPVESKSVIHTKNNENKIHNSQDNSLLGDASHSSESNAHLKRTRKGDIIELDIKKDADGHNLQFAGKPPNLFRCPCQKHERDHKNERIRGRRN